MNHRVLKLSLAVCAVVTLALGLGGCKENTVISSNVTPAIDNIHTFQITLADSFYEAKTVRDDSIVTSSKTTSIYQALGWVNDDIANTSASTYLQFVPKTTGAKIPATETLDSVFVILPYAGFTWGDTATLSTYTIKAFQIKDTLSIGATYYPFTQKATDATQIGSGTYKVGPKGAGVIADDVPIDSAGTTIKVTPHLRVKLDLSIASLVRGAMDTNTTFDGFIRAFNGVYLVPDTSGSAAARALTYFLVDGTVGNYSGANLLIYTHNAGGRDTTYSLPYNSTYAARYNRINRTFTDANIFTATSQWLAVQNQPGAAIDFRFKNLNKQTQIPANSIINKLEITFKKKSPDPLAATFFAPARIYPAGISSVGVRYTLLDRYPTTSADGLNFIDGTPRDNAGTVTYTLNIPREFQSAITTKQTDLHLLIGGTVNYVGAYRLLVGSLNNPDPAYRPVVKIIYSKQN